MFVQASIKKDGMLLVGGAISCVPVYKVGEVIEHLAEASQTMLYMTRTTSIVIGKGWLGTVRACMLSSKMPPRRRSIRKTAHSSKVSYWDPRSEKVCRSSYPVFSTKFLG